MLKDCTFFSVQRNLLDDNVSLGIDLFENLDNVKNCISFMDFIMSECKEILTTY